MAEYQINLEDPAHAYMFGFLQADGHLYQNTRNRGKMTLEIQEQDIWLIEQFAQMAPFHSLIKKRTRRTNYMLDHASVSWTVYDRRFREALIAAGMPIGMKSHLIQPPARDFSRVDFYRGIIDADGSLGITSNGLPFVSLVTASEKLAVSYAEFILEASGCSKTLTRSKRDGVFNIVIFKEAAQRVVSSLYYDGCLALPRKMDRASAVMDWKRPIAMIISPKKKWRLEEDKFVLSHPIDEAATYLHRTKNSIKMRLWRLSGKG